MRMLMVDDERLILESAYDMLHQMLPEAEILTADTVAEALDIVGGGQLDAAFLDIQMPDGGGMRIAKAIKESSPKTKIVFVTAYQEYAMEAWNLRVDGYLLKPLQEDKLREMLEHLQLTENMASPKRMKVTCFGKFDAYCNGECIDFKRKKTKEMFAYLVDQCGKQVSINEICDALWEDTVDLSSKRSYLRQLVYELRRILRGYNLEDVVIHKRSYYAVDVRKIDCDYYRYRENDPDAIAAFDNVYMEQYSWAEGTLASLVFGSRFSMEDN